MQEEHRRCTSVAIELLQTQDPGAILMLKKFLTYIPSPTCVKNILITAITELMDTSPSVICWLLIHPEYLQPEVDIEQLVTQRLAGRLTSWGFVQGQDFNLSSDRKIEVSEASQLALSVQSKIFEIQDPSPIVEHLQKQL